MARRLDNDKIVNFALSALEVSKHLKANEDVEDLKEFLTIFSLGDDLNQEICKFIIKETSAFFNQCSPVETSDDNSEHTVGGDSSESDKSLSDLTDEYYDSEES